MYALILIAQNYTGWLLISPIKEVEIKVQRLMGG